MVAGGGLALALSVLAAFPALAQIQPVPSGEDGRIAVVHYAAGIPARLGLVAGRDLAVLMPGGEHVRQVTVGDPGALHVAVPDTQDGVTISALRPVSDISLRVDTDTQNYMFVVSSSLAGNAPWLVRVERGGGMMPSSPGIAPPGMVPKVWTPPVVQTPGTWNLRGDRALQPASIRDDGAKVYIRWAQTQAIPAVFALDDRGEEQVINGYMRGDAFVIDRIFDHLVFRIDKAKARADRSLPKAAKR